MSDGVRLALCRRIIHTEAVNLDLAGERLAAVEARSKEAPESSGFSGSGAWCERGECCRVAPGTHCQRQVRDQLGVDRSPLGAGLLFQHRRRGANGHRLGCRTQLKREVDRRDNARIHPHILPEQFLETLLFYLHGVGARQEIGDIVTADGSGGTQTSDPCCLINSGDACSSHYGPAGVEDCSAERAAACLSEKAAD